MKIAVFLPNLSIAGPQIVAKDMIEAMISIGKGNIQIDVFYFFNEAYDKQLININTTVKQIGWGDPFDFSPYDIVHSHCIAADKFIYKNRKKIRGKKLCTIHNIIRDELKYTRGGLMAKIYPFIYARYMRKMDRCVVLNKEMKDYYAHFIPSDKIDIITNGRNIARGALQPSDLSIINEIKAQYSTIIGAPCWVTARKGLHQIVEVLPQFPQCAFVVIGDGEAKEVLEALAEKLGVRKQLFLLEKRANAPLFYPYFDIYAMTSYSEGVSLALLEAAGNGTPTVCSDIPQNRELFAEGEVAFFTLDNTESLSDAVQKLISNGNMYGQKMQQRFLADYDTSVMSNKYLALYHKITKEKKS